MADLLWLQINNLVDQYEPPRGFCVLLSHNALEQKVRHKWLRHLKAQPVRVSSESEVIVKERKK